jgi:hypothetical protein
LNLTSLCKSICIVILMYVNLNNIGDVMLSKLASSVKDIGFEPSFCLTNYYKTVICFYSAKHVSFGVSVNLSRIGDQVYRQTKSINNRKTVKTVMTLTWYRHFSLLFVLNAACLAEKQQMPIL